MSKNVGHIKTVGGEITKEQYLKALKAISENQKIVAKYKESNNLTTETKYSGLTLDQIKVVESKIYNGNKYLSFQVNDFEVQALLIHTTEPETTYSIHGAKCADSAKRTLTSLANWFKRRGMKVSVADFRDRFIEKVNYLKPY